MKAVTIFGAHDLRVVERPDPEPGAGEVLVRMGAGGICGSDMSYWSKGRVGDFAIREPMVLGHEIAGTVELCAPDVTTLIPGTRVAVDPSRPCLHCAYCRAGRSNLCSNMRFFGSAALFPHVQGAFAETFVCRADQCHAIPPAMPFRVAALAEPLAVALHGVRRAGEVLSKHVLVTGAGPIGMLAVLVLRHAGAASVTVTDLVDAPLRLALDAGADAAINIATEPERLAEFEAHKGHFDIAIEATGAPSALAGLFSLVRPGGRIVQLGILPPGAVGVPVNLLVVREIDYVGAFRFSAEFAAAVALLASGRIDITPVLSADMPADRPAEAFELAADRTRSIKVHLHF